jgi:hypothetical protein
MQTRTRLSFTIQARDQNGFGLCKHNMRIFNCRQCKEPEKITIAEVTVPLQSKVGLPLNSPRSSSRVTVASAANAGSKASDMVPVPMPPPRTPAASDKGHPKPVSESASSARVTRSSVQDIAKTAAITHAIATSLAHRIKLGGATEKNVKKKS